MDRRKSDKSNRKINKKVSANKLSDTYKDLDSLINLKTDIIKYLNQFKNKKVKKTFKKGVDDLKNR